MGVAQTSELYKGFIFDGIDSKGFGVYISGTGVYSAPERDIDVIEIHGRNGAYILDNGRFKNITLTYPAGMFGDNEGAFADGIRRLRNALASRKGYCKLVDEYNPLEYRMAVYRGGLDVDPTAINGSNTAAQFEIQFECKPQRFLIDGDQPVKMTNGGTITNPTLFDSKPLLKANGYGEIGINGETVKIIRGVVGDVTLARPTEVTKGYNSIGETKVPYTIPSYVDGDVTLHGLRLTVGFTKNSQYTKLNSALLTVNNIEDTYNNPPTATASASVTSTKGTLKVNVGNITMNGTNRSIVVDASGNINGSKSGGITVETRIYVYLIIDVKTTGVEVTCSVQNLETPAAETSVTRTYNIGEVTGYSSELATDGTIYIDLDICEAYRPVASGIVDLNANVDIPAEPPVLKSGSNDIAFDNTITGLDIIPRWWEV